MMKTYLNGNLITSIHQEVEKYLNKEFKVVLVSHQTLSDNDKSAMKKMLKQKAVNLSYVFNTMLLYELPMFKEYAIRLINGHLYVGKDEMIDNYHNMSLMDELLLRLEQKKEPIKISPFSDDNTHKELFLKQLSFEDRFMNFFSKIENVENFSDLSDFENEYHDYIHNMMTKENNVRYKKAWEKKSENEIRIHHDKDIVFKSIYDKKDFFFDDTFFTESHTYMTNSITTLAALLSNLNNTDKPLYFFNDSDFLKQHTSEFEFESEKIKELDNDFILKTKKENDNLQVILANEQIENFNLINSILLCNFIENKYKKEIYHDIYGDIALFNGKKIEHEKEYHEIINYAKNMKVIYAQKLINYQDYFTFYEQHEKEMKEQNVNMLSHDDYHQIYQNEKINYCIDFLKKSHQFVKEVYDFYLNHVFDVFEISEEEMLLFNKVKQKILQHFPEIAYGESDFTQIIREQEIDVIFDKDLPFAIDEKMVKKGVLFIEDSVYGNNCQDLADYIGGLNMKNLEKSKHFKSKSDFYFPYLKKDENLEIGSVDSALRCYNNKSFVYESNDVYTDYLAIIEFNVRVNGMKKYQLSTSLDTHNPCYLAIDTSCSNSQGFSQVAYDAMAEFAYQNNLLICRDLCNLSWEGESRLKNKLNKAKTKFPDALLFDYYGNQDVDELTVFGNAYNATSIQLREKEEELKNVFDMDLKTKKINEFLFKLSDEYFVKHEEHLKKAFNHLFFYEVVRNLSDTYNLSWERKKFLTKEQYQEVKGIYDDHLQIFMNKHNELYQEMIDTLSKVNKIMTLDEDNDWQSNEADLMETELLCDFNGFEMLTDSYMNEKLNEFQDIYLKFVYNKLEEDIKIKFEKTLENIQKREYKNKKHNKKITFK